MSRVHRTLETMRFVSRTYRTVHQLKSSQVTPKVAGEALALDASMMGPLYIKLAQFISSRQDAIDPEFAKALSVVQDRAPIYDSTKTKALVPLY